MRNEHNRDLMEDSEDEMLKTVMGGKFKDLSQGEKKTEAVAKTTPQSRCSRDSSPYTGEPLVRCRGEGLEADAVSPMHKVKACAKGAGLYGGISMLLFWWQQAGLLDPRAAVPSFVVLALLAGLQIGRVCNG